MNNEKDFDKSPALPIRAELLMKLLDETDHGITLAEREGDDTILLYVNHAFEQMTGYTADECLYSDCRFLQNGDRDQDAVNKINAAISNKEAVRVKLRNYRKDGSLFWNDLSITPYFDKVEGVMYYIGIQRDVTERTDLKQQLRDARAQIEELERQLKALG
ncbi:MAG: PAS domain S-box-containing protein [uncultured Thiotrichaceae bacterium]|uniref:PAS domain S-box-containing protein n=1 Tax=uncultured Thiotrichaceae bacterium TaxID=298394 RepID=A0A6S6U421_9GAMM|nr:MAG: PAS domain S-box-containing protein [uncultured Thiotrichaceae bacterium]